MGEHKPGRAELDSCPYEPRHEVAALRTTLATDRGVGDVEIQKLDAFLSPPVVEDGIRAAVAIGEACKEGPLETAIATGTIANAVAAATVAGAATWVDRHPRRHHIDAAAIGGAGW